MLLPLPSPREVKQQLPLNLSFVSEAKQTAKDLFLKKDPRLVVITGPCSIHNLSSAREYARRLKALSEEVADRAFLVMRVYAEKPRTVKGWKGLLYDPHLDGSDDIKTGIYWTRELFLELAEMQVPTATEFLDPLFAPYIDDLVTWGFIGARTVSSQTHRQLASSLTMPIGFKNDLDGNVDHAIHGIIAARHRHTYLGINSDGKTSSIQSAGNPFAHAVLRGSVEAPNYDAETVNLTIGKLQDLELPPRLLVDCSHGNCNRQAEKQVEVFHSVLEQIERGNEHILGLMLESHLEAGNQVLSETISPSISLTDPCIAWSTTEELIASI